MNTLSHGLSWVDLQFRGRPQVIATGLVQGHGGVAIVDPGPTSCLETLELGLQANGIRWPDVRHILLTHIHLDHAGATGTIVREHPHIKVLVHERGIKHMVDPTKLIESATRVYRDRMDELWGEFAAVPASNLVSLTGGERIEAGGRTFDVAYTPGHASHHVSYFDDSSGVAFVGDTAGVCINGGYVLPPTPPPDIDVEAELDAVRPIVADVRERGRRRSRPRPSGSTASRRRASGCRPTSSTRALGPSTRRARRPRGVDPPARLVHADQRRTDTTTRSSPAAPSPSAGCRSTGSASTCPAAWPSTRAAWS